MSGWAGVHIITIPCIFMLGAFIGFIFGGRAARNVFDMQARRDAEREVARAARAARKAGEGDAKVDSK